MKIDKDKVQNLLCQVFDEFQESENLEEYENRRQEFVFHMTDWIENLEELSEIYTNSESYNTDVSQSIAGFLYHVIPHLNMAGRLLLDKIPDPFQE